MRLGEETKKERKNKKPQGKNIMACPIQWGGHNQARTVHISSQHEHQPMQDNSDVHPFM